MISDCIFCKIIAGEIPSDTVYSDETITAFRDINPAAPTHILIIPNKHIPNNNAFQPEDEPLAGRMFSLVRTLAEQEGIAESGYRLIMNTGPDGRQEVHHMHLHLIGGQRMRHPMG
ncbi:MAG: histidine triad nucleotide-binding protein [Anaerolineae bacterium]|nr:histidine triad nucleotide-binding protein [Anaerolineae bacterium]